MKPARALAQLGLPLLAAAGLLAGVLYVGRRLGGRDSTIISFADLECDPPSGMTRQEFLAEVQYLAELPDRPVVSRVAPALARHPWVAEVTRVSVRPRGRALAELRYREPALAVEGRVVDGDGVLLPRGAKPDGLPKLTTKVAPAGRPGKAWGDVRVVAAARVAALLRPRLELLGLAGCRVEVADGDVSLHAERCRLTWGRPPGLEKPNEPDAATKLRRLADAGSLTGEECDARPAKGLARKSLPRR